MMDQFKLKSPSERVTLSLAELIKRMSGATVDGDEKVYEGLVFYTMVEWWCTQRLAGSYGDMVTVSTVQYSTVQYH